MTGDLLGALVPLMALGVVVLGVPRRWLARPSGQTALVLLLAVIVARYLWWRLTVTVWPVEDLSVQTIYIWTLFLVEMLVWFESSLLFAMLLRRTDRGLEADYGEVRLRTGRPEDLPTVDVLIATYNEPLDVLERTIIGALALDWPTERLRVYVLDDGRREWLRWFCELKGACYLTRADNKHAKAGNINAAIQRTSGEFFMLLDADFIPQRNFLYRAMGLFNDPKVGIVQVPHSFFNHDPVQTNLGLQKEMPDDQRLFFNVIMPGRDGWDCAFCCGSNSITRRRAIEAVGGGLPTDSVTEDILLTMALLKKGYVTRYLNERLAVGLAPESLAAFFVQRARWAQGGIQTLYLRSGPLGPGLRLHQRLFFLPTHWLSQSFSQPLAMAVPAIYLWTGLSPLANSTTSSILSYQVPAIVASLMAIRLLAPKQYFPLASIVDGALQAFRLLPTILVTLVKPHGHAFKVTPKGANAGNGAEVDRPTLALVLGLIVTTALGLWINTSFNYRPVADGGLSPLVVFWAIVNMIVLLVMATVAVTPPRLRSEERFPLQEPCEVIVSSPHDANLMRGVIEDLSLSGAMVFMDAQPHAPVVVGGWLIIDIAGVGRVAGKVRRRVAAAEGLRVGLEFDLPVSRRRDALIVKLFTGGIDNSTDTEAAWKVTWKMLARVFKDDTVRPSPPRVAAKAPDHVAALCVETGETWSGVGPETWSDANPDDLPPVLTAA